MEDVHCDVRVTRRGRPSQEDAPPHPGRTGRNRPFFTRLVETCIQTPYVYRVRRPPGDVRPVGPVGDDAVGSTPAAATAPSVATGAHHAVRLRQVIRSLSRVRGRGSLAACAPCPAAVTAMQAACDQTQVADHGSTVWSP